MDKRGLMMLRVLINRFNPKAGNALLEFLPPERAKAVMDQQVIATDLNPIIQQPHSSLEKIHYSWIQPVIGRFPESLRLSAVASLDPEQIAGLNYGALPSVSVVAKMFLQNQFYRFLGIQEHFPVEYLPETELTPLASWKKSRLIGLIDFLGLHDLASDMRQIVDRNHLKNIYACLTPKQFQYLKMCLNQKEQLVSPKLGIDASKQDCPLLTQIVHRRGLLRLGKALCGQHPDLVWHLAHVLDMGRGNVLLKEFLPKEISKVTLILKQQVLNIMRFLKVRIE